MLAVGLLALYGPTVFGLAGSLWRSEEHFHGPIVLAVTCWLLWKQRSLVNQAEPTRSAAVGWALFAFGLVLYVLGRSQDILLFEVGSAPWVLAGLCVIVLGPDQLRRVWFPILFLGFMVPLPGVLVDALTGPLKGWVSAIVADVLYAIGYPIGRSGVMLTIGPYQLLIADACSGLNSMFSLGALGTLYVYLVGHAQRWRVTLLSALILPFAFIANLVRVLVLVLITFYLGDEAGQGFLHGFSGMVLFLTTLGLFLSVDWFIDAAARVPLLRGSKR
jgi:exosortase B